MKKTTHRKNLSFYLLLTLIILGGLLYGLFRPVSPQVAMIGNSDGEATAVTIGAVCAPSITSFSTTGGCGTNMVKRVDTLCGDGRKSFENSTSCVDPIAAYQRAKVYCGETCRVVIPSTAPTPVASGIRPYPTVTPTPTFTPTARPSCIPQPSCMPGKVCPMMYAQEYCQVTNPSPVASRIPTPTPTPIPSSTPQPSPTAPGCYVIQPFCWSRVIGGACPAQIVCPSPVPFSSPPPITSSIPTPHVTPWPTVTPSPLRSPVSCTSWNFFGWQLCGGSWQRIVTQ